MSLARLILLAIRISSVSLLTASLSGTATKLLFAQSPQQLIEHRVALSGRVVTQSEVPVASAQIVLKSLDTAIVLSTVTDSSGVFSFELPRSGTYTVACHQGTQGQTLQVVVGTKAVRNVRITLESAKGTGPSLAPDPTSIAGEMKFSDKPNFTVAGVTDWTAVGGHGSDATLRTSEDLTRETLALKRPRMESIGPDGPRRAIQNDDAENRLRSALAAAPHNYAANHDLGMYYLHSAEFQLALPLLQAASTLNGRTAQDEYDLALACQGSGAFAQARQHVQFALTKTNNAALHQLMGDLEEKLDDPLSAVQHFEAATQLNPDEQNYFNWASELLLHRAIWQAAEVYAAGTKAYPSSIRLKTGRGAALFAGALYDEAARQLCEASDLDPANVEPYQFLGKIASVSPISPACVQPKLERFLALQPTSPEANYMYAKFLLKQGSASSTHNAETLLQKAVAADPRNADAFLQLGILSSKRKSYREAMAYFMQAIRADPKQGEAHYRLGVVYDRMGESEESRQQFALHDQIEKAQAESIEKERLRVKQFLIVLDQTKPDNL